MFKLVRMEANRLREDSMRVLMLGWEFPPFISGGLGTACYGLTQAMSEIGVEIIFVLPRPVTDEFTSHVKMASPTAENLARCGSGDGEVIKGVFPGVGNEKLPAGCEYFQSKEFDNVSFLSVPSMMQPYQTEDNYLSTLKKNGYHTEVDHHGNIKVVNAAGEVIADLSTYMSSVQAPNGLTTEQQSDDSQHYGRDLYQEVQRYSRIATVLARNETFDVIHAHDWMTYPAGIAISKMSGKPLVTHIHSTEFDRSGENVNQMVYDIEHQGLHHASRVIAVSRLTRDVVTSRYAVEDEKIEVVYNAIEHKNAILGIPQPEAIDIDEKVVLFLGRITMQKGPEYFLQAAKLVLSVVDNVKFVMAGSGDLTRRTIEMAAEMGIGHKVLFTGFLRGDDVDKVFQMADLFVMPSVSEPFGLVPLEALRNDVPVLISKQSGVAEVLTHALKVDFWDVHEMANKILAVLKYPPLRETLREHGHYEMRKLSWTDAGQKCLHVYESVL